MGNGYECWSTHSSPVEAPCHRGAISDTWGARGRTLSVDGQPQSAYDKMIQDRFPYTQDNFADAYKEAAKRGLPLVAIFGSWEHNNSRALIQDALPKADPEGRKAVYIYVDPTKCPPGDLADFAQSQIAGGHNAAISIVFTVKPDSTGKPQPEPYTFRWQGDHPSMIPSFNQALDEAQRKMETYKFASEAPSLPPPREQTPPQKMDHIVDPPEPKKAPPTVLEPKEKEKEKAETAKLRQQLDAAKQELEAMKKQLEDLKRKDQGQNQPAATSEKKDDFDLNSFLGGAASATAIALLAKWIANRGGRTSELGGHSDSKPTPPEKPSDGGALKPTKQELELVKKSLELEPNTSDAKVQQELQKAITAHIKKALNMEHASDEEMRKAISADNGAALKKALGLPPNATSKDVFEKVLSDLAIGRAPTGNAKPVEILAVQPKEIGAPKDPPKQIGAPKDLPKSIEPLKDSAKQVEPSGRVNFSELLSYTNKFVTMQDGLPTSAADFQNLVVKPFIQQDKLKDDPLFEKMKVTEGATAKLRFLHRGEEVDPLYRDQTDLVLKKGNRIPVADISIEAQLPKNLFDALGNEQGREQALTELNTKFGSMLMQVDNISTRKDRVQATAPGSDLAKAISDRAEEDHIREGGKAAELSKTSPLQKAADQVATETSGLVGSPTGPKVAEREVGLDGGLLVVRNSNGTTEKLEDRAFNEIFEARRKAINDRVQQLRDDPKTGRDYVAQAEKEAREELAELRAQQELLMKTTPEGKAFRERFGKAISEFVAKHGKAVVKGVGLGCSILLVANTICRQFDASGRTKGQ